MKFIPFRDKIEIKPFKKEQVLLSDEESLIESGIVISIGEDVTFVKPGDHIFFDSWGCMKTPENENNEFHYVVHEDKNVILGKYESAE